MTSLPFFQSQQRAFAFFGAASIAALAIAYIAEYAFGLRPCELCLYQRAPFFLAIFISAIGLFLSAKKPLQSVWLFLALATTFAANAVFAAYHTGVERKWWPSFLEGCTIPEIKGNIEDMIAQIQAAPIVRCDEIAWVDPAFGLSMANYNIFYSALLAGLAIWCFGRLR